MRPLLEEEGYEGHAFMPSTRGWRGASNGLEYTEAKMDFGVISLEPP